MSGKIKIVFMIPNMTGGGTERVISLLADSYVRRGYEITIMQFAGYEHAYELNPAVEDFSIAPQSKGNPLIMIRRLKDMKRYFEQNPDCYIFAFCVMGAITAAIAAPRDRRHLLVAERNNPLSCNIPHLRNWAYHRADVITFQTEAGISYFDSNIAGKAVVIPNPIDAAAIPGRYEGVREHKVVTVGRLHKQKNQKLLLSAFSDFYLKHTDYELHIYGRGELESELKEYAAQLKVAQAVVWHGFSENVKEEIRDSRMFVLSSDYEGISNSMLEAIAMGVPVISTDCPIYGARSYMKDGISGLLTPVGDRAALAEAMCRIADDDELAERISVNGAAIRTAFGVDEIADRFTEAAGIL